MKDVCFFKYWGMGNTEHHGQENPPLSPRYVNCKSIFPTYSYSEDSETGRDMGELVPGSLGTQRSNRGLFKVTLLEEQTVARAHPHWEKKQLKW